VLEYSYKEEIKMHRFFKIIIPVLIVFLLSGCSSSNKELDALSKKVSDLETLLSEKNGIITDLENQLQQYKNNDNSSDGDETESLLSFEITKWAVGKETNIFSPANSGKYLAVQVKVANNSKERLIFNPYDCLLVSKDGDLYKFPAAHNYLINRVEGSIIMLDSNPNAITMNPGMNTVSIDPKFSTELVLFFNVPDNNTTYSLSYNNTSWKLD